MLLPDDTCARNDGRGDGILTGLYLLVVFDMIMANNQDLLGIQLRF